MGQWGGAVAACTGVVVESNPFELTLGKKNYLMKWYTNDAKLFQNKEYLPRSSDSGRRFMF